MLLSSVLITTPDGHDHGALPPIIAENIASLKAHHPELDHRLFREADAVALIEEKFPREVLDAYSRFGRSPIAPTSRVTASFTNMAGSMPICPISSCGPCRCPRIAPSSFAATSCRRRGHQQRADLRAAAAQGAGAGDRAGLRQRGSVAITGSPASARPGPALFGKALATTCEAEELMTGSALLMHRGTIITLAPDPSFPTPSSSTRSTSTASWSRSSASVRPRAGWSSWG